MSGRPTRRSRNQNRYRYRNKSLWYWTKVKTWIFLCSCNVTYPVGTRYGYRYLSVNENLDPNPDLLWENRNDVDPHNVKYNTFGWLRKKVAQYYMTSLPGICVQWSCCWYWHCWRWPGAGQQRLPAAAGGRAAQSYPSSDTFIRHSGKFIQLICEY